MSVLADLIAVLSLERIEENIFRGQSQNLGWGRVFGGQVVGQALSAAEQTVPEGRTVHSLHGYFLRPGDAERPIVFTVDPIRDGKSFTTRRVVAVQGGVAIFNMAASFQIDEGGYDHADPAPGEAPEPDGLRNERELGQRYLDKLPEAVRQAIPDSVREQITAERPIEVRPVDPIDPVKPQARPGRKYTWFRASEALPDQLSLHQYLLAYASDFHLLGTTLLPHAASWLTPGMQVASLDHAMWFHRAFRFDEWLLYSTDSPTAQHARGFARGQWFTRDGVLVASTAQEGLIRNRNLKSE